MATPCAITIGATNVSSKVLSAYINPISVSLGHGTFVILLDNKGGTYNNLFPPETAVDIDIDGAHILNGFVDSAIHSFLQPGTDPEYDVLRVQGRDNSQGFQNRRISKAWPLSIKADKIIEEAITEAGWTVGEVDRITYTAPNDKDTVGGYFAQDEKLIDILKNVCTRANLEGYVDASKVLQLYSRGSQSSGITLNLSSILPNSVNSFNEGSGLEIINEVVAYGLPQLIYPLARDAGTEPGRSTDAGPYSTQTYTGYVLMKTFTVSPSGTNRVTFFRAACQPYCLVGAGGWYKITYQFGSGTETTLVIDQSFNDVEGSSYLREHFLSTNNYTAPSESLTIRFYLKAVQNAPAETVYLKNLAVDFLNSAIYVTSTGNLSRDATRYVYGGTSIKATRTSASDIEIVLHFPTLSFMWTRDYNSLSLQAYVYAYSGSPVSFPQGPIVIQCDPAEEPNEAFDVTSVSLNTWLAINIPIGYVNQSRWRPVGAGTWDWKNVDSIRIKYFNSESTTLTLNIDDFLLSGKRVSGSASDATSQTSYAKRMLAEYLVKNNENEVSNYATSVNAKQKDPIKLLRMTVNGSAGISGTTSYWRPGYTFTINNSLLGISAQSYRLTDIELQYMPRQPIVSGFDFVAFVSMVPAATNIDNITLETLQNPDVTIAFVRLLKKIMDLQT